MTGSNGRGANVNKKEWNPSFLKRRSVFLKCRSVSKWKQKSYPSYLLSFLIDLEKQVSFWKPCRKPFLEQRLLASKFLSTKNCKSYLMCVWIRAHAMTQSEFHWAQQHVHEPCFSRNPPDATFELSKPKLQSVGIV